MNSFCMDFITLPPLFSKFLKISLKSVHFYPLLISFFKKYHFSFPDAHLCSRLDRKSHVM